MARLRGRSRQGQRLPAAVPWGHWRTTTLVAGVRKAIKKVGAFLLYLPPYSPDLNPIEQLFAKLKALLRKTAARTVEDPWQAIAQLLDKFLPRECTDFFRHAGYGSVQS